MSQPGPTAKGSLAATPFAHLLVYALDHRLTGTIVLEAPGRAKHAVYLTDGAPAQARTATPVALLGELVRERGNVQASTIDALVSEAQQAGRRSGTVFVERGLLDAESLEPLLREQVVRRLEHLATLPAETAYGYYERTNFLERAGGPAGHPSPLAAIWRVIRRASDPRRVREVLARLGSGILRFHPEAPLGRFDWSSEERAIVDVLRAKPQTQSELTSRGLADPARLELLLYAFSVLRFFDTGSGTRPIGSNRSSGSMRVMPAVRHESPVPAAPPPRPAELQASTEPATPPARDQADPFRRELAERLGSGKQSYYEVLGVPDSASGEAIGSAFFQLAKRFHPDRLGAGYEDVREQATRLFARMTEAHQVLSDPTRRKEYDELLKHGAGAAEEQEEVQRVVRAVTAFQKALVLLKRNHLAQAEVEARQALADDPSQADHVALVAWLEASKPGADLEAALKTLSTAVKMEDANLRVRWYRGQILKRLGHERRAVDDFRFIVDRDPHHVDAQRELRLFDMRRASGKPSPPHADRGGESGRARTSSNPPPPGEKGGFLGKLFKR